MERDTLDVALSKEAQQLYDLLKNGRPHREVYRAADGSGWYITHQRGRVNEGVVSELIRFGYIRSCYSNCPSEAYHVGKTFDVDATLAERKNYRQTKDTPIIYTDGSREFR